MTSDEPRGPSAIAIQQVVSAYQQLLAALSADPDLVDDESAIIAALQQSPDANPDAILDRMLEALAYAQLRVAEAEWIANEAARKKARYTGRADQLRATILAVLEAIQRKRFRSRWGTASVRDGVDRARITDVAQLPDEYVFEELVRHPKLPAILADLQEGVVIAGAEISNGGPSLVVRRDKSLRGAMEPEVT